MTAEQRRASLAALCEALSLPATAGQIDQLATYLDLLQRWNRVYNLTAVRDVEDMLTHHIADCLAVVGPMARAVLADGGRILDVGSGGGLPGALLAVMLPAASVTSIDTVGKKAAFIQQVATGLKLPNLNAVHARVEQWQASAPFDLIVSRAFSSLSDFIVLTRPHLAHRGVWAAMKGKHPRAEIEALPGDVEVFHVEQLQVPGLDAERCLVWMRPLSTV